ncbi:hypothetical protein BH11BAC2_BH11BAC2_06400 [soil metagenome]
MDTLLKEFKANEIGRESQKQIKGGYMYVWFKNVTNGNGNTFDWYHVYADDGTYLGDKPSNMPDAA